MPAKIRQLWIGGTERTCTHDILDEVRSEGGQVIAERCQACGLIVAQWGPCYGCGRERRCCHFVTSRGKYGQFCSRDCYQHTVAAEKIHRDERKAKRGA